MRRKIAVLCIVLMFISLFSGCMGDDQTPTTQPTTVTPTTVTPTTAAPTTAIPTTAAPTTAAPTTAAPTVEPTTAAPTTVKPTTKKPTTKKPTTAKVTTAKPTTVKPTTAAPTTVVPTTLPVKPVLSLDKTQYQADESVMLRISGGEGGTLIIYYPDGHNEQFQNVGTSVLLRFSVPGLYNAVMEKNGEQSNVVIFTILAPPTTAAPTTAKPTTQPTKPLGQSTLADEKGRTLKILIPGHNLYDNTQWQNRVVAAFQAQYPDVTVQFVTATWNDWEEKMLAAQMSGDPVDLIYNGVNSSAVHYSKGLIQPVTPYVNMNNPYLHKDTMDACFKYAGDYYVAAGETNFAVIYYNKDTFTANGLEDPMALYERGEWTWAKFVRYAKTLTNRDQGIYGYASEYPYLFFGSNATSALKLDANNRFALNLTDPSFVASLELIQDGWYTSKWQGWEGSAMGSFQMGKAAMVGSWTMYESSVNSWAQIYGWDPINYGAVPLPAGPNNPGRLNMVHSAGWSISMGADCPAHAGKLIDMLIDAQTEYQTEQNTKIPAVHLALYQQMRLSSFCVNMRDSAVGGAYELANQVAIGTSVAQAIEMYKPGYQRKIDEINPKV